MTLTLPHWQQTAHFLHSRPCGKPSLFTLSGNQLPFIVRGFQWVIIPSAGCFSVMVIDDLAVTCIKTVAKHCVFIKAVNWHVSVDIIYARVSQERRGFWTSVWVYNKMSQWGQWWQGARALASFCKFNWIAAFEQLVI